jgi:hypothetical protein
MSLRSASVANSFAAVLVCGVEVALALVPSLHASADTSPFPPLPDQCSPATLCRPLEKGGVTLPSHLA